MVVPSEPTLHRAVDYCQGAKEDKVSHAIDELRIFTEDALRFPILFVSLTADPVTPLTSAIKMSRGFGNKSATLLIQEGYLLLCCLASSCSDTAFFIAMATARTSLSTPGHIISSCSQIIFRYAHPSLCTVKNTRDYFIDGKVPANGTRCTPE